MKNLKMLAVTAGFIVGLSPAFVLADMSTNTPAQGEVAAQGTVAPDNSAMNQNDQNPNARTADQGGNRPSDRQIMAHIRKAVVADSSLSTYAHNVKIISVNGKVTLKGPVRSADEKQNIEAKAGQVVGTNNVVDHLRVMP
jgi:osmotically-inducible protein OsmY